MKISSFAALTGVAVLLAACQTNEGSVAAPPVASVRPAALEVPPNDCGAFIPGTWSGTWPNGRASTLDILHVAGCAAKVRYSWGAWNGEGAGENLTEAQIIGDELIVPLAAGQMTARLTVTAASEGYKVTWQRTRSGAPEGQRLAANFK